MTVSNKAESALMAVFPSIEAFLQFAAGEDNREAARSFCQFAFRQGLIINDDEEELKEYILARSNQHFTSLPPADLTFEMFLEQKKEFIKVKLSERALTNHINSLLTEHRIKLPKVTNAMFSRLKKKPADTTHKQNVLRSIAFWIGYMRPAQAYIWNFKVLCIICSSNKSSVEYKEGARIGFAFFGRGDVINHEIIGWLKKNIRSYIEQSISRFSYGRWGKVRVHDVTTLYVDFPKEKTANNPEAYHQCLRSALSLVHQISIRWALSKYQTSNRFLSIGIAVGSFSQIDNHLTAILNAKLPDDPTIRLTDYARQCLLINGIRVLPCKMPEKITLINGEALTIWWVVGFWSSLYFDFIPQLMEDTVLKKEAFASKRLNNSLWSMPSQETDTTKRGCTDSISAFFKYPSNSLLGLEIAKTLFYQRRLWEAIEILKILLSLNPTDLVARTMRMSLLSNLALDAPTYDIAFELFNKAHNEADYIKENCLFLTEDFYCEHALIYLTHAMLSLRYLRKGNGMIEGEDTALIRQRIFKYLVSANVLLAKGELVTPSAIRSYYLQNIVKILIAVLESDKQIFVDHRKPIDGNSLTIRKSTRAHQWQIGYLADSTSPKPADMLKAKVFRGNYLSHKDAIALQAYRPAFFFCAAVAWWDFFPIRTIANARIAVHLLRKALEMGKTMQDVNFHIYSFTRIYGEMIHAEEFIDHIKNSITMIEEQSGGKLFRRDENEIIEPTDSNNMSLLMTLNF